MAMMPPVEVPAMRSKYSAMGHAELLLERRQKGGGKHAFDAAAVDGEDAPHAPLDLLPSDSLPQSSRSTGNRRGRAAYRCTTYLQVKNKLPKIAGY